MLELAILGLLHDHPMHGYELRKQLNALLGTFRAFSYGSLYPSLRRMAADGLLVEDLSEQSPPPLGGKRGRVVYRLTAEGKERLQALLADDGPGTYEQDELFGVHLAFFAKTPAGTRLKILEGRRRRVTDRRERLRTALTRTRERLDRYTLELQRHGLDSVDREVRWLDELIEDERRLQQVGQARSDQAKTGAGLEEAGAGPQENRSVDTANRRS